MPPDMTRAAHVLVCGLGHVGYRVVRLLRRLGVEVTAVGDAARPDWQRDLGTRGVRVLLGDVRDPALLTEAGLAEAQAVVAATDSDLANLEVALDARRARGDVRLVLRTFNRDLARSLEHSLGAARALGVSALAGPVLAAAALGQDLLAAFSYEGGALGVARIDVNRGSPLADMSAGEIARTLGVALVGSSEAVVGRRAIVVGGRAELAALLPKVARAPARAPRKAPRNALATAWSNAPKPLRDVFAGLAVLAAVSLPVFWLGLGVTPVEAFYYIITTLTTTGYGDITPQKSGPWLMLYSCVLMLAGSVSMAVLYSFATNLVVSEQLRRELGRPPIPAGGHVIVVGLGNVGYRTWDDLVPVGVEVVVVDAHADGEFVRALEHRVPMIVGDSRLRATLHAAGVETAAAIVAATGDDAVNLAVALTARRLAPQLRTVVRVFDADFAQKLEQGALVDVAVSTSRVAAPTFAAAALRDHVIGGIVLDDELVTLATESVAEVDVGQSPRALGRHVLLAFEGGRFVALDPDAPLRAGMTLIECARRPYVT